METVGLRLTQKGNYTIQVTDCDVFNTTFDYLLSLTKLACGVNQREVADGPEAITFGQITRGTICLGDIDTYGFAGSSNDVIAVGLVKTNGTGNPTMRIWDPTGN